MSIKKTSYPATLLCDFYKISHREQYPQNTKSVYSTWIPRTSRLKNVDYAVAFGFQGFIKEYLINYFNEHFFNRNLADVLNEYHRVIRLALGVENPDCSHIQKLHNLGFLPIKIKALKEGTIVPLRIPMLTIENTYPEFFWLTNYLETLMSCCLWMPSTSATIALQYKQILDKYALETGGDLKFVQFQGHDFSMRGMSSLDSAKTSGAGHLLSFVGTDTIPAILYAEELYNGNMQNELLGCSVSATEHSVASSSIELIKNELIKNNKYKNINVPEFYEDISILSIAELGALNDLITEVYPSGIVSIVSDTFNLWDVLTFSLPLLKETILARDGKVVIRPDCYDDKTEILTNNGWKLFKNLDKDKDLVAQFSNGAIDFTKPLKYYNEKYQGKMIRFYSDKNKIDLVVTPNHKMIRYNANKKIYEKKCAENIKFNHKQNLPVCGKKIGDINELSFYDRLMIAFQADGRCKENSKTIEFGFSKQRKIDRLIEICEKGNFEYKITKNKSRQYTNNDKWNPQTTITVYLDHYPKKFFNEWVNLEDKNYKWCEEFIEELSYWDATRRTENRIKYDSTIKSNSIIVQTIGSLAGYRTTFTQYEDNRSEKFNDIYCVHIVKNIQFVDGQSIHSEEINYEGTVHCVTVPSGAIVVKRNNQIAISGNSGNPIDIICGTAQIEDLSNECETLEDCKNVMKETITEKVTEDTPHGEIGTDEEIGYFKFDNKIYEIKIEFEWDRYDKQYYYLYCEKITSCKEAKLTVEQKGVVEILWDVFGGTVNSKGYKVLDPHIGCIYGDAITIERCEAICKRLQQKGFASTNMVFGIGSYTYQYNTRDTLGFALKSTHIQVGENNQEFNIVKDPITDSDKVKKSLTGRCIVYKDINTHKMQVMDSLSIAGQENHKDVDMLQTIFLNGQLLVDDNFQDIRNRLTLNSLNYPHCPESY